VFASLTEGANASYRKRMAIKSVLVAGLIILGFALSGAAFLDAMGISIDSFRIFGGLLLFLVALEMVFARESGTRTSSDEQAESRRRADISVFPLAFPFMSGPGALTTILLWFGPVSVMDQPALFGLLLAAAILVLLICLVVMLGSGPLMRMLGATGTNVANRLLGVILGALAVQFIVDGIRASLRPYVRNFQAAALPALKSQGRLRHLHTPVSADLLAQVEPTLAARALHPTPAVAGSPARTAVDWLAEREGFVRGWYAGAVGVRGDGSLHLAVAIRSALVHGRTARVFVGAGVVPGSLAEREWEETELKASVMLRALGVAEGE